MRLLTAQRAPVQGRPTPHRHKRLHRNLIQKSLHLAVTQKLKTNITAKTVTNIYYFTLFSAKRENLSDVIDSSSQTATAEKTLCYGL